MYVPRPGNHKMPVWLANMKQSDLGLHCFSIPFRQATCVRNFRMSPTSKEHGGSVVEYLTQD